MNRPAAWIAAAVAVLACCACARQAGTAPPAGHLTTTPPAGHTTTPPAGHLTAAAIDLVTDSGARPARRHAATTAEEEITRRCMAGLGEIYRPSVPSLPAGDDEQRLVDLPLRRAHGYGLADQPAPPSAGPDEKRPEFHRALFGDGSRDIGLTLPDGMEVSFPSTGCVAEGRAAVYQDVVRWGRVDSVPQVLNNRLRAAVKDRPELVAARAAWANCMRSSGLPFPSQTAARDAAAAGREREITIAVADGKCDLEVHLTGTELTLRRAAANDLPPGDRRELTDLAAVDCAAAQSAARILDGPPTSC